MKSGYAVFGMMLLTLGSWSLSQGWFTAAFVGSWSILLGLLLVLVPVMQFAENHMGHPEAFRRIQADTIEQDNKKFRAAMRSLRAGDGDVVEVRVL